MERRALWSAAFGVLILAAVASPAVAAEDAAAQFMVLDVETQVPFAEFDAGPPAGGASLLALRYRERRKPARDDVHTIVVTEHPAPLEARYRPRHGGGSSAIYGGSTQIHGGFFDPDGDSPSAFLAGIRGGPKLDEHVQLGASLDWRHHSTSYTEVVGTATGPGGEEIEIRRELGRSTSDWMPIQMFVELNGGSDLPVIPYFGVAGGYQWLWLSGDDASDGSFFDATFSGWGWQMWGGAALPLGPRTRLNAEVFINGSELHHDSIDAFTGDDVRETIDMDGLGMRFGLAWGFF